jgi:tetratricopeptide (TPR) repeat protein
MTTCTTTSDETGSIYPIQFIERGEISALPAPLVRLSTCGCLTIEVLEEVISFDAPQARYRRLAPDNLRGRGIAPALTFLKLLASQSRRYAKKDFLREHLSRLDEEAATDDRVDDVASLLRGLLYPSPGKETPEERKRREKVRKLLVAYVHGSKGSGGGFCLGEYPLVWVDTDALAHHVTFAARMDRFRDPNALPSWERAYHLASPGPYLPDELYSDWTNGLREEVEGYLRQSVHALSRLYLACYGEAGEEELQIILRNYWLAHKTDEDVLRPLMELLGKQERYGEALDYYTQCEAVLAEQGLTGDNKPCLPDERTRDIAEYLRTKQIQRESGTSLHSSEAPLSVRVLLQKNQNPEEPALSLPNMHLEQDVLRLGSPLLSQASKQAIAQGIMEVIQQWGGHDHDMKHLSRREAITALLSLVGATEFPLEWWEHLAHPRPSAMKEDEFNYFQQILEGGWGFLNVGEWNMAENVLESLLPDTIQNAPKQRESALLAAQGLLLRSLIEAHRMKLATMVPLCKQAVAYAKYAGDHTTLCATLNGLAVAFKYNEQEEEAFKTYIEALCYCGDQAMSLIRSRVYAGVAASFACKSRKQEADLYINLAYEHFPSHPELDPHFLSADHGFYMLAYYKGIMYLALNQPQEALEAFESYQGHITGNSVPRRNQLEITNHKGRAAIWSNKPEVYTQCLREGIEGALEIKSQKRLRELVDIFQKEVPSAWHDDASVVHIIEQYPFLLEATK